MPGRWLLLIHQLPKEPAYLRVKIGRRLARVGAVALKNSVYLLPKQESTMEDFQWVRREVVEGGGEATVLEADLIDGLSDADAEAKFRETKDAEYAPVIADARALRKGRGKSRKRDLSEEERSDLLAEIGRLERRVEEVAVTDFFGSSGREIVAGLLQELRMKAEGPSASTQECAASMPRPGRTWVTRAGLRVDRIASAWLIRRQIDREATFKFVPPQGYRPLEGEVRFDMFEAEFSHEGDQCTFETLLSRFSIVDPGLRAIADMVHDIDIKESLFARPETSGFSAAIEGICRICDDDEDRLVRGTVLLEALYAHFAAHREAPT